MMASILLIITLPAATNIDANARVIMVDLEKYRLKALNPVMVLIRTANN